VLHAKELFEDYFGIPMSIDRLIETERERFVGAEILAIDMDRPTRIVVVIDCMDRGEAGLFGGCFWIGEFDFLICLDSLFLPHRASPQPVPYAHLVAILSKEYSFK
jgi:hypothetical protein